MPRKTVNTIYLPKLFRTAAAAVIILILCCGSLAALKQDPVAIETGYYGETLTHPGITIGLGYTVYANDWYTLTPTVKLGWYVHPRNHHGLFISAGVLQKASLDSGLGIQLESMAGLLNTCPDGEVLEYSREGTLDTDTFPWEQKLMISVSGGISWHLQPLFSIPFEPFVRTGAFLEYPFNSLWLPHAFIETGFRKTSL